MIITPLLKPSVGFFDILVETSELHEGHIVRELSGPMCIDIFENLNNYE